MVHVKVKSLSSTKEVSVASENEKIV